MLVGRIGKVLEDPLTEGRYGDATSFGGRFSTSAAENYVQNVLLEIRALHEVDVGFGRLEDRTGKGGFGETEQGTEKTSHLCSGSVRSRFGRCKDDGRGMNQVKQE